MARFVVITEHGLDELVEAMLDHLKMSAMRFASAHPELGDGKVDPRRVSYTEVEVEVKGLVFQIKER